MTAVEAPHMRDHCLHIEAADAPPLPDVAALTRLLVADPDLAETWTTLAAALGKDGTARVSGRAYTPIQCLATALGSDDMYYPAWFNLACHLATTTDPAAAVTVRGQRVTQQVALVHAVELYRALPGAWFMLAYGLGRGGTVTVDGAPHTEIACYRECLGFDDRHAEAWYNVGLALDDSAEVAVRDRSYDRNGCFLRSLELKPRNVRAWVGLSAFLSLQDAGATVPYQDDHLDTLDCALNAIACDSHDALAWQHLSNVIEPNTVAVVDGERYTDVDCVVRALHEDGRLGASWCNLGALLPDGESRDIDGLVVTNRDAAAEALRLDPALTVGWFNLGVMLKGGAETHTVAGKAVTSRACYLNALQLDNTHSGSWHNLGCLLSGDTVKVGGLDYDTAGCFAQAKRWAREAATTARTTELTSMTDGAATDLDEEADTAGEVELADGLGGGADGEEL